MKNFLVLLVILVLLASVLAGCSSSISSPSSSTASKTASPATTTASAPPATQAGPTQAASPTSAAPSSQPQYGGTFKVITTILPANIGYLPTMTSDGTLRSSMWAERLMDLDPQGNLVPCLAESWNISPDGLLYTFNLRKGVKFQDGTDFNADAVKWNYQQALEAKALPDSQFIKSIDVADPYTIKFTLNQTNSLEMLALWRPWLFSPTAIQQNGKDWAVTHPVSTSAFKVTEYQRDVVIKMEKNTNYWRQGRPYLDAIEYRLVKDPTTCSMIMQSGQADMWIQATPQEAADLRDSGMAVVQSTQNFNTLAPDSATASSPFANSKVREALEYALDRPAIAKALGRGFADPMDRLAVPGSAGWDPSYKPRTFDPAKARQLLSEAGYASGLDTSIILQAPNTNLATVIQNYLNAVGIRAKLDVADSGKFYSSQQTDGWKGLILTVTAISPEYAGAFVKHYSKTPDVKFVSLAKTDQFYAAVDKVLAAKDTASLRDATRLMVTQASLDAMVIPVSTNPSLNPVQKYVNTTYTKVLYPVGWKIGDDWLAKK
jgi:peptide/nickel transport system substrate-binding protein